MEDIDWEWSLPEKFVLARLEELEPMKHEAKMYVWNTKLNMGHTKLNREYNQDLKVIIKPILEKLNLCERKKSLYMG